MEPEAWAELTQSPAFGAARRTRLTEWSESLKHGLGVRPACAARRLNFAHGKRTASASTRIAMGVFAQSCADLKPMLDACIGCGSSWLTIVALLDVTTNSTGCGCELVDYAASAASVLSFDTLTQMRRGVRVHFQKTRALHALMLRRDPHAQWFVKVDTDVQLNMQQMQLQLSEAARGVVPYVAGATSANASSPPVSTPVDYVGKQMRLFRLRESQQWFNTSTPFVYMQGGAVALSARAAASMSACPRGAWATCPHAFFFDGRNFTFQREQLRACVDAERTQNVEDLFVGACMAEAGMLAAHHPCFFSVPRPKARDLRRELGREASDGPIKIGGMRLKSCRCPASLHPLKSAPLLQQARGLVERICGLRSDRRADGAFVRRGGGGGERAAGRATGGGGRAAGGGLCESGLLEMPPADDPNGTYPHDPHGRWCCSAKCGFCQQRPGCSARALGRMCCPSFMLKRRLREGIPLACSRPNEIHCRVEWQLG